jgi:hypothetical protein
LNNDTNFILQSQGSPQQKETDLEEMETEQERQVYGFRHGQKGQQMPQNVIHPYIKIPC